MLNRKLTGIIFFLSLLILVGNISYSQSNDTVKNTKRPKNCEQQDIKDLFRKKDKPLKPPKKTMVLVLPNVSSNPANGFLFGVGGSVGWYFGPKETTRVSFAGFSAAYTTNKQFLSFIKSNVYTSDDKFFLTRSPSRSVTDRPPFSSNLDSSAFAIVDFPEPESPVKKTVNPCV